MGLELPLALLGLAGVLIPLLAHRMRRRELQRVVLPTFALLSRAAALSQRKRSLSDLLLLVLRIAIVVLACLGLAAPYVTARVRFGDGRAANVAIVIDDSLSMSRRQAGTSLIELARARALDVLNALPDGSEVCVVLAGKPARLLVPNSRDLGSARRALEAAALPSVRSGELAGAVELALRQQSRGHAAARRLLVV
jgi:Ca-activated chloride channel family protein